MRGHKPYPGDFADGTFFFDAPRVIISCRKVPSKTIVGSGIIELLPNGLMEYRIYGAPRDENEKHYFHDILLPGDIPQYDFTFIDTDEHTYYSYEVEGSQEVGFDLSFVLHGYLEELHTTLYDHYDDQIKLILSIPYELELPYNYTRKIRKLVDGEQKSTYRNNLMFFHGDDWDIEISSDKSETTLTATSMSGPFGIFFYRRLAEALALITMEMVELSIIRRFQNGNEYRTYRSVSYRPLKRSYFFPCRYDSFSKVQPAIDIFAKYLQHTQDYPSYYRTQTASAIHAAIDARDSSLETQGLVLTTGIEAMITNPFESVYEHSTEETIQIRKLMSHKFTAQQRAQVEQLKNFINNLGHGLIKDRLQRTLDNIDKRSATSLLRTFVRKNFDSGSYLQSWMRVRNKLHHAEHVVWEMKGEDGYKFVHIYALFFGLIFHRIDYKGPVTSYSTSSMIRGLWPYKTHVTDKAQSDKTD